MNNPSHIWTGDKEGSIEGRSVRSFGNFASLLMGSKNTVPLLLLLNNGLWVNNDTWQCMISVASNYFNQPTLFLYDDSGHTPDIHKKRVPVITFNNYDHITLNIREADSIVIMKNLNHSLVPSVGGRTVIVTESLAGVDLLWTRLKLLNFVIILQDRRGSGMFTWFPYVEETCWKTPKLVLLNDCPSYIAQPKNSNLFPSKIPKTFSGCPLNLTAIQCHPFIYDMTQNSLDGMEGTALKYIAASLDLKINFWVNPYDSKTTLFEYYNSNKTSGKIAGVSEIMENRNVDLAGGCLMVTLERYRHADVSFYHFAKFTLAAPAPTAKPLISGLYSGFAKDTWILIMCSLVSFSLVILISQNNFTKWSISFLFGFNVMLGMSNTPHLRIPFITAALYMVFQLYSLHVLWFYQSTLLMNLFREPHTKPFLTLEDVADSDLVVLFSATHLKYFEDSTRPAWIELLKSNRHVIWTSSDDNKIYGGRSNSVFGAELACATLIKHSFPKEPVSSKMSFLRETFIINYFGFYFPKNHPLFSVLTSKLHHVIEAGFLDSWKKNYTEFLNSGETEEKNKKAPLRLDHLQSAFYVYFILIIMSCLVLLMEINRGRTRPRQRKQNGRSG